MKAELKLPSLRVAEQNVPGAESSKFKRSCGDKKLGIFPFLKVNCISGALRTKNQWCMMRSEKRGMGETE